MVNEMVTFTDIKTKLLLRKRVDSDINETWYRCSDHTGRSGGVDVCGNYEYGTPYTYVKLHQFKVAKHTPKGVRLFMNEWDGDTRVVLHDSRKKFAHPELEDAVDDFMTRKKRQIWIYNQKIKQANEAMNLAQRGTFK